MSAGYWSAVITLLIGWFLNELHHWFWSHRKERKPFGKALTELLEIRHELKGFSFVLEELRKRFSISEEDKLIIKKLLNVIIPKLEDLHGRFNDAVTSIASIDPVLAFRLRLKDQFSPFREKILELVKLDKHGKELTNWIEDKMVVIFMEDLEELIIDVAKSHGFVTWLKVRKRISKPNKLPKGIDEIFSLIQAEGKNFSSQSN